MYTHHSGFCNISWCNLTIDKCTVIDFNAHATEVWDLFSDDNLARLGVIPTLFVGDLSITGRKIGALALTYLGRSGDMTLTILDADGEVGSGDTVTLKDAVLVGIGNRVPSDNIGEKVLTFLFSNATGSKEIYTIT